MRCIQIGWKRPVNEQEVIENVLLGTIILLTNPLYLKESCTERSNNQNGHRNSNRNSTKKSAVITIAHKIRNFIYNKVLL